MIIRAEMLILKMIDYNIFFRDYLIIDRIKLYLECVKNIIDISYQEKLRK